MPKEKLHLSNKDFKEFYDSFGSSHFQLQSEIFGDLGTKHLNVYFKSIGFATTVIGVIGLIAGFGFTAIGYVKSIVLFISGEALLLSGLFYGLLWVQHRYESEFNDIEKARKKYRDFYDARNKKFIDLYNSWLKDKSIDERDFIGLNNTDKKSIELFYEDRERKTPPIYSRTVYILMMFGTICLLSSFIFKINLIGMFA